MSCQPMLRNSRNTWPGHAQKTHTHGAFRIHTGECNGRYQVKPHRTMFTDLSLERKTRIQVNACCCVGWYQVTPHRTMFTDKSLGRTKEHRKYLITVLKLFLPPTKVYCLNVTQHWTFTEKQLHTKNFTKILEKNNNNKAIPSPPPPHPNFSQRHHSHLNLAESAGARAPTKPISACLLGVASGYTANTSAKSYVLLEETALLSTLL